MSHNKNTLCWRCKGNNGPRRAFAFWNIQQNENGNVQNGENSVPDETPVNGQECKCVEVEADEIVQEIVKVVETVRVEDECQSDLNQENEDSASTTPFVIAYDEILNGPFAEYLTASNKIGGDVQEMALLVDNGFKVERAFLVMASKNNAPSAADLPELMKPTSESITKVQEFRDTHRKSKFFNNLSAISEGIPALGWIAVRPKPAPYVQQMEESSQFYINKVLVEWKGKDPTHTEWANAWKNTLKQLATYVKTYHTTGLAWNKEAPAATANSLGSSSAPGAPPAPGPPPPPPPAVRSVDGPADAGSKAALFAEINKGFDVTRGLKKVSDDMKTHKNPALRQGPKPFTPSPKASPVAPPKSAAPAPQKQPKFELQNKKWIIEFQENNKSIVIDDANMKQTVYMYKCNGSTLEVKGKVNSITLDSCKKTAVVFQDAVSMLEFINCQSVQGQVLGRVPTISIDKTDGCQIYLSKESMDCEIVTAKSSEMNMVIPDGDDFKERALPEQFKTRYNGKEFVTVCTESV